MSGVGGSYWRSGAPERRRTRTVLSFEADRRRLRIGLVNNMVGGAKASAARQFTALLQAAAGARPLEIASFVLGGVAPGGLETAQRPAAEIAGAGLDALVVTGAEPRTAALRAEPFWPDFEALVAACAARGLPVLFSCLAAHAAVSALDGIARRPLAAKRCGVFRFAAASASPLTEGLAEGWRTPHSRWNGLAARDLRAAGYTVLGVSRSAGVDAFTRRVGTADWLFLQGHPEYEADTLLREARRDLTRYLDGARQTPPAAPQGLLTGAAARDLHALLAQAQARRDPALIARWPASAAVALPPPPWRSAGAALCRNWLSGSAPATRPSARVGAVSAAA